MPIVNVNVPNLTRPNAENHQRPTSQRLTRFSKLFRPAQGLRRGISVLLGLVMVGMMWSLMAAPGWAATWSLVARNAQGEQWFDPASVEVVSPSHVQVSSYYVNPQGQRTIYLTEYDCEHQWFRDVDYDGPVGQPRWQSVADDPLNAATMVKSCQIGGYPIAPD